MKTTKLTQKILDEARDRVIIDGENSAREYLHDDVVLDIIEEPDNMPPYICLQLRDGASILFTSEYVIPLNGIDDEDIIVVANYVLSKVEENGVDVAIEELIEEGYILQKEGDEDDI